LFTINLNQRKLITINAEGTSASLNNASAATLAPLVNAYDIMSLSGIPSCTNGTLRPWALKIYRGKGYLGVVCDGATSQSVNDVKGYVLSFDPLNIGAGFTNEVTIDFNYRTSINRGSSAAWHAWVATWAQTDATEYFAQPVLSDIEFDETGSMNLSIMDRWGHQIGVSEYIPLSGSTTTLSGRLAGDMLHVCQVGSSWVMEGTAASCTPNASNSNLDGIGDGITVGAKEFYNDVTGDALSEGSVGAMAKLMGTYKIVETIEDPTYLTPNDALSWFSNGIGWFDITTGAPSQMATVVRGNDGTPGSFPGTDVGTFQKANGLGDIEFALTPAPLEIGNRVFFDTDKDGLQDANEAGINGIIVELYEGATKVGSTTTATINGQVGSYLFTTANVTLNGATAVLPNTVYEIRIPNTSGGSKQAVLGLNILTTANQGANDLIDSDGTTSGTNAIITLTTGTAGQNNHSYDFGFSVPPCTTITNPSSDQTLCSGAAGTNITVNTDTNTASSIKFVKFADTDQILTNGSPTAGELTTVYAGTSIATVTPTGASNPYLATYTFLTTDFPNTGTTVKYYYVYAILTNDVSGTCRPMQEIKITVNPLPTFISAATDLTCYGSNDGTLTINSTTGTAPFTYSKDDGVSFQSNGGSFTGLLPAFYQPAIKDANGCVKKCN
ncbi:MAG: hypothetical protein RLZZ292_2144, partial [Bacteroidota bacterium]